MFCVAFCVRYPRAPWIVDAIRESGLTYYCLRGWDYPSVHAFRVQLEALAPERMSLSEVFEMSDFLDEMLQRKRADKERSLEATDEKLAEWVPLVYELLTRRLTPDGKPLTTASLTFFAKEGQWRCVLKHRSLGYSWWGEGATFEGSLEALEASMKGVDGQKGQ